MGISTWKTVSEEEAMMKETSGKEREAWHKKTWRFIHSGLVLSIARVLYINLRSLNTR